MWERLGTRRLSNLEGWESPLLTQHTLSAQSAVKSDPVDIWLTFREALLAWRKPHWLFSGLRQWLISSKFDLHLMFSLLKKAKWKFRMARVINADRKYVRCTVIMSVQVTCSLSTIWRDTNLEQPEGNQPPFSEIAGVSFHFIRKVLIHIWTFRRGQKVLKTRSNKKTTLRSEEHTSELQSR